MGGALTLEDLEALLEDIDFMTIIYGLFEFEESGTLTISGWSKNLRTNLGYDLHIYTARTVNDVFVSDTYPGMDIRYIRPKKRHCIDGLHCTCIKMYFQRKKI